MCKECILCLNLVFFLPGFSDSVLSLFHLHVSPLIPSECSLLNVMAPCL